MKLRLENVNRILKILDSYKIEDVDVNDTNAIYVIMILRLGYSVLYEDNECHLVIRYLIKIALNIIGNNPKDLNIEKGVMENDNDKNRCHKNRKFDFETSNNNYDVYYGKCKDVNSNDINPKYHK